METREPGNQGNQGTKEPGNQGTKGTMGTREPRNQGNQGTKGTRELGEPGSRCSYSSVNTKSIILHPNYQRSYLYTSWNKMLTCLWLIDFWTYLLDCSWALLKLQNSFRTFWNSINLSSE